MCFKNHIQHRRRFISHAKKLLAWRRYFSFFFPFFLGSPLPLPLLLLPPSNYGKHCERSTDKKKERGIWISVVSLMRRTLATHRHTHIHLNAHKSGRWLLFLIYTSKRGINAIKQALWSWVPTNEHIIMWVVG